MSTIKSAPTFAGFAFDVPEPQFFDGEFVYNYFVKEERVTSNVFSDKSAMQRHTPRSEFNPQASPPGVPARKIILKFTALENVSHLARDPAKSSGSKSTNRTELERKHMLMRLQSDMKSEVEVQTERTNFLSIQDDEIASSLQSLIDSTLLHQKASQRGLSPVEAALKFNSLTSDKINADDILQTTDIEGTSNLTYYDPATGEDLSTQGEAGVSRYAVGGFYNSKFVYDILSKTENTPFSPIWGTVDTILEESSRIQTEAVSILDSNRSKMSDYEFSVNAVEQKSTAQGAHVNTVKVVGYLIEKFRIENDGTNTFLKTMPVASLSATQTMDYEVVYGENYRYSIKTVFELNTIPAGPNPSGQNIVVTYLITSRGSPFIEISCNETVPPPPPENIQFFLSSEQKAILFWDMPKNTQEDIKRFQIFRRSSLEDPYTIIAQLDFDDSLILTERSEFIPSFTTTYLSGITLSYSDPDFEFDKVYYYAICSIDAHDLSSPYSTQFKVYYDRNEGKMNTTLIAFAGAPKPYPNFTIRETLTSDCIKDSGHSKLKIYFDPECLVLMGPEKEIDTGTGLSTEKYRINEELIETSSGRTTGIPEPMYKLQIINLDRQQDQKLDIYLKRSPLFHTLASVAGGYYEHINLGIPGD